MNIATNLTATAARCPDRPAVRLDGAVLTYADLAERSARVAAFLRAQGVRPGDRVAVMLPNVPEFATAYFGILRAGAVVVPMNPLLKEREVAYYLADSDARLILAAPACAGAAAAGAARAGAACHPVDGGFADASAGHPPADDVADRADGDTAVILYTSGTTGRPKGAQLTHANLATNVRIAATELFHLRPDDVVFGGLPLFHSFGQTCGLNAAVSVGACLTLIARFTPEKALEVIERDAVTVFQGVPTMYVALLGAPGRDRCDASALRLCVSGGAALPVEVLRGFERAFGCVVLEGYGLSETSPIASFNHPDRQRKAGSIGTPIRGVDFRVVDEDGKDVAVGDVGEIVVRGHNVMAGYWRRPEETAAVVRNGWFHTGDLARVDEDGYFFIVDRKKEMIIRGGFNVYPREIEEVLYEHPAVAEVAVVGIPDATLGEEIGAAVVLRPGSEVTRTELADHVKGQLAPYKYPRRVWFVPALPKGPTGKVLKREIRPPEVAR
ncbi:long-chain-fatty-acid--CoA ligase [Virgisporangium aurantiacum]|uniref:Long-chain-fatty-acid--CoA ligase n=1 Tax=Virgisporangium aurantiacum TaxID=175570 RepID=A0A8J3Z169_9ACTN|nr:long-chain fatty acid--CoA ligase [Virgisporangium aurantiacum]GIJ54393.1 long-chain-fatty-acid--CoA ligase [Virgisporangium aurantiacum]